MDSELIQQTGYIGLFIISFLGASLLPLSTEIFVLGMVPLGFNVWWIGLVATVGNYSGTLLNYYMGYKGIDFARARYFSIKEETWQRAQNFYEKWGPIALFFSWIPIIGDPLTAVAGALKMGLKLFTFWVFIGKGFRYAVLLGLANQILAFFTPA